ncbi:MAG: TolC family protein [Candidatus Krumholzibacteriota bacterium]|nr:TolC family protein [Candidatus Krumholzibacteriota bacterium]
MLRVLLPLLGLLAAPELSASSSPPGLEDLVAEALAQSPVLAAARERWDAADEAARAAGALPDPRLGLGRFVREVESRVGPQRHKISLSQTIPWFGTLGARREAAAARAEAAGHRLRAARREVIHEVTRLWIELAWLDADIAAGQERLALAEALVPAVTARYEGGEATVSALVAARAQRARRAERLAGLRDRRPALLAALGAATGRAPDDPPDLRPRLPDSLPDPDAAALRARLAGNPELGALAAEAGARRHEEDLARKAGRPDFTLGLEWVDTGEAAMPGVAGSGDDPFAVTLGLNLPLWRGSRRAAERGAAAGRRAALAERDARGIELSASLEGSLADYRAARRRDRVAREELIPLAERDLAAAEAAYAAGGGDFATLLAARALRIDLDLESRRARTDGALALAALWLLAGPDPGGDDD